MYTEIEQQTLDIDWFFTDKSEIAFVASAGGKLPHSIAELDDKYGVLSSYFRGLPEISDIVINPQLKEIKTVLISSSYLSDFIFMARRGLYSFDKTILTDFSNTSYHLVVSPLNALRLSDISDEILNILINTQISKHRLSEIQHINIIEIK